MRIPFVSATARFGSFTRNVPSCCTSTTMSITVDPATEPITNLMMSHWSVTKSLAWIIVSSADAEMRTLTWSMNTCLTASIEDTTLKNSSVASTTKELDAWLSLLSTESATPPLNVTSALPYSLKTSSNTTLRHVVETTVAVTESPSGW